MIAGTTGGQPQDIGRPAPDNRPIMPYHVSRCAGDELAFALFERLLEEKGFSDWRPDGIVLSKGADDPSDKLSDEYLKSRDGELFNIRVQGPAVTSTWAGDPALEVMPLDKVFVVIVADVWWRDLAGDASIPAAEAGVRTFVNTLLPINGNPPGAPSQAQLRDYLADRETEFRCGTGRGLVRAPMPIDGATGAAFTALPDGGSDLPGLGTDPGAPVGARPAVTIAGPEVAAPGADPGPGDGSPAAQAAQLLWQNRAAARQAWLTDDATEKAQRAAQKVWDDQQRDANAWQTALNAAIAAYRRAVLYAAFENLQVGAYEHANAEATRLCNFRVMLATSSQMINYSAPRYDGSGHQVCSPDTDGNEFRRVHNQSRMGLRLGVHGGEYIVGGWCVGNVLDTAASRAAFPSAGTNIGVRTAPNSMAMNLNVKVEWWDADRMWRSFMNVDGSLTPRYVQTKPLAEYSAAGVPSSANLLYSAVNMPPNAAAALRRQYLASLDDAEKDAAAQAAGTGGANDYTDAVTALAAAVTAGVAADIAAAQKDLDEVVLAIGAARIPCAALYRP